MKKLPLEITTSTVLGDIFPKIIRDMSSLGVSHFTIRTPELPVDFDGLKIAHLSDLHNRLYGQNDINLYKRIAVEKPDIIVMTGDMISHGGANKNDFINFVRIIAKKYPVFYVNGNHEYSDIENKEFRRISAAFKEAGAACLDNAFVTISRGNAKMRICGLSYPARFYRGVREYKRCWNKFGFEDMLHYTGTKPAGVFTMLLAHNPLDFDVYAKWGADVTFSGHVHGGFIRLPLVGGVVSPEMTLFPKYKEGIYRKGKSFMVVSRGLGRIRIANPPELVMVKLKKV